MLPQTETSIDAFHHGAFAVVQPMKCGHRAGSDALLLAAGLPQNAHGIVADLGAGAGVAAFAALSVNPLLRATLVEIDPLMADCARKSLALPGNSAFAARATIIAADVRLAGKKRVEAGLANAGFDHVLANPPYYAQSERASPDKRRALAHHMPENELDAWLRTAAAMLKPGGMLHIVWRPQNLLALMQGAQGRFGSLQILPLCAREASAAGRIIVRGIRGSKAPLSLLPAIILHDNANKPTPLANALLNGKARLPFLAG